MDKLNDKKARKIMKKIKKNVRDCFRTMEKQSFTHYSDVEMEIVTFTQHRNNLAFLH